MQLKEQSKLLRIFLGESDKVEHTALYDVIIHIAKEHGLAGATVWRGIAGFGKSSHIRTTKILDLSSDLPVIVEIVDEEEKIAEFIPVLNELFDIAACGGLVTIEDVKVITYHHGKET